MPPRIGIATGTPGSGPGEDTKLRPVARWAAASRPGAPRDRDGGAVTDLRPSRIRLSPFFANLLPEGKLRDHLARRAGS